ncbi:MAG: hypothetical protein HC927_08755 [Deltaproteobacteria bacterium]|nr:hypothetical protein [Deltaproteobacteria bacterium]
MIIARMGARGGSMRGGNRVCVGVSIAASVMLAAVAPGAMAMRILVDLGASAGTTASPSAFGQYWNNFAPGGNIDLVESASGQDTGFNLDALTSVAQGNGGGLSTPSSALLGDLAIGTATGDYLFNFGGTSTLRLFNLDAGKIYDFRIFATRATDEARETLYTIRGGNKSDSASLVTSGINSGVDGAERKQ